MVREVIERYALLADGGHIDGCITAVVTTMNEHAEDA